MVEEVLLSQSLITITYKSFGDFVGCTNDAELDRLPWTILTIYIRFTPHLEKEGVTITTKTVT